MLGAGRDGRDICGAGRDIWGAIRGAGRDI
jgi:hypothetical protein